MNLRPANEVPYFQTKNEPVGWWLVSLLLCVAHGAAKKARSEAEQRAAAAEAELKAVRAELEARVAQLEGDLSQRLQQAHSIAEERLEQHTEAYRCQVRPTAPLQPTQTISSQAPSHESWTALLGPFCATWKRISATSYRQQRASRTSVHEILSTMDMHEK